jgi:phosphoglucomutase
MTLFHVSKGKTILKRLEEIYREFGYFEEILISKKFEGQEGKQKIRGIMDTLRKERPGEFAGRKIVRIKDYLERKTFDVETHTESAISLPKSNVIQFILDDESIISIRPSGTEPKIKFYASCRTEPGVELERAKKTAAGKLDAIRRDLEALTG